MSLSLKAELFLARLKPADHPAMPRVWINDQDFLAFLQRKLSTFQGFTVLSGVGFWKSEQEPSQVVVVYGPTGSAFKREIAKIARDYAAEFKQEAVAYAFTPANFYLTNVPTDEGWEQEPVPEAKAAPA